MEKATSRRPSQLADSKPLYLLPRDPLAEDVLIPGFSESTAAVAMVGFFSSSVLSDLAPGLASYVRNTSSSFKLIVSPYISASDQQALEDGLLRPEDFATHSLQTGFVSADDLQRHTLRCLSYLLATSRIEIQVALMKDALFHPKVWIFDTALGKLAAHGSSNMTNAGIRKNKEQITISKSWEDAVQKYIVEKLSDEFERLWINRDDECIVLNLPDAVKERILREYGSARPPTEDDFRNLYRQAIAYRPSRVSTCSEPEPPLKPVFTIPTWLTNQSIK